MLSSKACEAIDNFVKKIVPGKHFCYFSVRAFNEQQQ